MKRCSKCGIEKPLSEFSKDRGKKDGLRPKCKECDREQVRKWREENLERVRRYQHKHKYGEDLEEKERRYREQDGKCEICGGELGDWWSACMDHDHDTNKNRGLLHQACNKALGLFRDSPTVCMQAAFYLMSYGRVVEVKIEPSDA